MCGATAHVRFTPNSDRESDFPAEGHVCLSRGLGDVYKRQHAINVAIGGKADIPVCTAHVRL